MSNNPNANKKDTDSMSNQDSIPHLEGYSAPSLEMTVTISSEQAARYINRQWDYITNLLYNYDVKLRTRVVKFGKDYDFSVVDEEVNNAFEELFDDVSSEHGRLDHLLKEHNIDYTTFKFSKRRDFDLEIRTPLASQLLSLIQEVDKVEMKLAAVWIKGIIESREYSRSTFNWQQRLFKNSRRFVNVVNRAQKAANILEDKLKENEKSSNDVIFQLTNIKKTTTTTSK